MDVITMEEEIEVDIVEAEAEVGTRVEDALREEEEVAVVRIRRIRLACCHFVATLPPTVVNVLVVRRVIINMWYNCTPRSWRPPNRRFKRQRNKRAITTIPRAVHRMWRRYLPLPYGNNPDRASKYSPVRTMAIGVSGIRREGNFNRNLKIT